MLSLLPRNSHKIQPLNRNLFSPLKNAYSQECNKWHVNDLSRALTQFQIRKLYGNAYEKIVSIERAVKTFEICGNFPYNPNVILEDFASQLKSTTE